MNTLRDILRNGRFFAHGLEVEMLAAIHVAFGLELEYLKTAYVVERPQTVSPRTISPSKFLYRGEDKHEEIDRTITGIYALRWIHDRNYRSFTRHQLDRIRLNPEAFEKLCRFFRDMTTDFKDHEMLLALITMQTINDLGKSEKLMQELHRKSDGELPTSENHDVVIKETIEHFPELVPSLSFLSSEYRTIVPKLIDLSADFNPAQLVQGECPPASLEALLELGLSAKEVKFKFMEMFLDLAGAKGHMNHEGALAVIQPVFHGYWYARDLAVSIADGKQDSSSAYWKMLMDKIAALEAAGWEPPHQFEFNDGEDYAKARLLCAARAADTRTADQITNTFDHLPAEDKCRLAEGLCAHGTTDEPAVLPSYLPAMIQMIFDKPGNPSNRLDALFRYLARVFTITDEEMEQLPADAVIVERDLREIAKVIKSSAFNIDPHEVLEQAPLPKLQVAKRLRREIF